VPNVNPVKTAPAKKVASKASVSKSAASAVAKPKAPAKKAVAKPAEKATKAKPVAAMPVVEQKEKVKKPKLIRDSFTMPEVEYQVLSDVKKAFLKSGISVKKSELLRAGVMLLKNMDIPKLNVVIAALVPLKAGRPKNEK
jgi:hypothetical protein